MLIRRVANGNQKLKNGEDEWLRSLSKLEIVFFQQGMSKKGDKGPAMPEVQENVEVII